MGSTFQLPKLFVCADTGKEITRTHLSKVILTLIITCSTVAPALADCSSYTVSYWYAQVKGQGLNYMLGMNAKANYQAVVNAAAACAGTSPNNVINAEGWPNGTNFCNPTGVTWTQCRN